MIRQLLSALRVAIFITIVCGILYPLSVLAIGNLAFADKAQGSLIRSHGKVVGSSLLGQTFEGDQWFHSRPSNAGEGYDATASAASNLGPTHPELIKAVTDRVAQYRQENNLKQSDLVPVDAVTSSGSGLDPDISLANAHIQAKRVAKFHHVSVTIINKLIVNNSHKPIFGFLGQNTVDVVTLNRDLDELTKK